MLVDVSDIHLRSMRFLVTRSDGKKVNFSELVTQFTWADHVNVSSAEVALSVEGSAELVNRIGMEGTTAVIQVPMPDPKTGQFARRELWRGFFEEVVDEEGPELVERQITAYDAGKLLSTHEEDYVFRGSTLSQIVSRVATDLGLPLGSVPSTSRSLGNLVNRGDPMWDLFQKAIQKHKNLTGETYRVRFSGGRMSLVLQGSNPNRWIFEKGRSLQNARRTRSIADLENRIKIYGQVEEDLDRPKLEATEENKKNQDIYGLRQRVEYSSSAEDEKKVVDIARERLKFNSSPTETIEITGFAVPLRAGERTRIRNTGLGVNGLYYVESVESQWSADGAEMVAVCRADPIEPEVFLASLVVA